MRSSAPAKRTLSRSGGRVVAAGVLFAGDFGRVPFRGAGEAACERVGLRRRGFGCLGARVGAEDVHVVRFEGEPFDEEVDEGAHLRRLRAAAREYRIAIDFLSGPAGQDAPNTAEFDVGLDHHVAGQHQALSAKQRAGERAGIVGDEDRFDADFARRLPVVQGPVVAVVAAEFVVGQRAMRDQFVRMLRFAVTLDVARAGVELRAERAELARDQQGGIRRIADAQRNVDLAGDEVERFVGEHHLDAHFRMARVEFAEQRRDPGDADRIRRGQAQPAARATLQLADGAFGFFEFARDALTVLEVDVARFGEAELARRAMQELRAESSFEILHAPAHCRLRQAQRTRRGDEAAVFDDLGEDQCVVEVARHGLLHRSVGR